MFHTAALTVEQSLKLDSSSLIGKQRKITSDMLTGNAAAGGSVSWSFGNGRKASIGFQLATNGGAPALYLMYTVNGAQQAQRVTLDAVPCHYGGNRYYFECPQCRRRARCLYLPPGSNRFGCRQCKRLTYASCQQYTPRRFAIFNTLSRIELLETQIDACKRWRKRAPHLWKQYMRLHQQLERETALFTGKELKKHAE
jgi:hypothetical protein